MAALTPVASVDALVSAIDKSGLLTAEALEKVREAASKASDPKALARDLVKSGVLTRWQAEQLINGYHRLVVGNYKLLDQLGTSPTGRIYLAEHAQMGRRHTLKVLARRLASNTEAVKQFLDSARDACSLDHRNVSHVYDVNQDRIGHYVVMEHIEGQTLEEVVERSGRIVQEQGLDYVRQAAEGLAHAHSNGVVHGDLKPSNLLRDFSGTIKILEIGQTGLGAKPETEEADESVETASLAAVIFQAPELRGDGDVADVACDVYSIGSVLCFLLTAKAAKDAAAAETLLKATPGVSLEVAAFCRSLMNEDRTQRPRSMEAVLADISALLKQLAAGARTKADQDTAPDPASLKEPKREKWKKGADVEEKRPLKAKEADEPPVRAVLIPDAGTAANTASPVEAFSIKTRGRLRTKLRKADAEDGDEVEGKRWDPLSTPLVLAGAIGGGGVLVLGLGILVVCLLAMRQSNESVVEANAPPVNALAAAKEAPAQAESNPEAPVMIDANPAAETESAEKPAAEVREAVVTAVAEPKEAKATEPSAAAAITEPKAPVTPTPEPKVAATPTPEPKVAAAPVPEPKAVAKTEPAPAAEPKAPAAKPAAKAATPADPFAGFAKVVSLPELPDSADAPATAAAAPVALGPCVGAGDKKLAIALVGGDTAIRASRQKFELVAKADDARSWDVALSGGAAPVNFASLNVENDKLMFRWTEEGIKQAAVARQLGNCALLLGAKKQIVALREVVTVAPLVVDLEKPNATTVKWNVGNLPLAKQVFIEVMKTDGFKKIRTDPKTPVNVGDGLVVATGASDKSTPLLFKLTSTATANTVDVKVQPTVKLEGWNDARLYRRKDLVNLQQETMQPLSKLQSELRKTKDSRPPPGIQEQAKEATIERLSGDIERINRQLAQLGYVLDFANTTEGQARIHFRIYCVAGEAKIDLLRTETKE